MGSVDLSKLGPAPPGFDWVRGSRGVILCREGCAGPLEQAGFSADSHFSEESLLEAEEFGKEPLVKLRLKVQGDGFGEGHGAAPAPLDCLVRRFSHGGLARALTGRRFKDPVRPFEELRLSEALREESIPTPMVIAARAVRHILGGYELALVTERLPRKVDVGILIGRVRRGDASRVHLRRALVQSARLIAAMHTAGFLHADLQPANLLVPAGGGGTAKRGIKASGAAVLDLDRSEFLPDVASPEPLPESIRWRNLGRLWRHVHRREQKYGVVFSELELALFLRAYGLPKEQIAAAASQVEAAAASKAMIHRAGWWLDALLGRGQDQRA